jgi:hypothetical protein
MAWKAVATCCPAFDNTLVAVVNYAEPERIFRPLIGETIFGVFLLRTSNLQATQNSPIYTIRACK